MVSGKFSSLGDVWTGVFSLFTASIVGMYVNEMKFERNIFMSVIT